jgi:hypothetical protein
MPEQLTKHPDVTLQVLRSAGAQCGEGAPQGILKQCPGERFCKLPGGEVCIYGLADAPKMTQLSAADWAAVRLAVPGQDAPPTAPGLGPQAWLLGGANLVIGILIGAALMRWRQR